MQLCVTVGTPPGSSVNVVILVAGAEEWNAPPPVDGRICLQLPEESAGLPLSIDVAATPGSTPLPSVLEYHVIAPK